MKIIKDTGFKFYSTFVVLSVLITGCSSSNKNLFEDYPDELTRFAIVSLSQPGVTISKNSTIGWHPGMRKKSLSSDALLQEARVLLDDILAQSIEQKGFRFYPWVRAKVDYWLAYRVILDEAMMGDVMVNQFGMEPGFIKDGSHDYEKGTLVVDLINARTNQTLWRSSAQGLVAPDIPEDLRRFRLESAIDQMLTALPQ